MKLKCLRVLVAVAVAPVMSASLAHEPLRGSLTAPAASSNEMGERLILQVASNATKPISMVPVRLDGAPGAAAAQGSERRHAPAHDELERFAEPWLLLLTGAGMMLFIHTRRRNRD